MHTCVARGPRVLHFYEGRPKEFIMRIRHFQRNRSNPPDLFATSGPLSHVMNLLSHRIGFS
jgi:hypothetical protein